MEELRDRIRKFVAERDWEQYHSPKNLAMALSVEVSEIIEHLQWLTEEQSRNLGPDIRRELRDEIADVLIIVIQLSDKLEIDPVDAALKKLDKIAEKYPVDKAKGKAEKYDRL
jgi:dCTP diphosphatase